MGLPAGMSALTARQYIAKFIGQTQMGTIAAKVNTYTIFKGLSLHITGRSFAEPSIACATDLGRAVHRVFFSVFSQTRKVFIEKQKNTFRYSGSGELYPMYSRYKSVILYSSRLISPAPAPYDDKFQVKTVT
jgi:hypothetical protein